MNIADYGSDYLRLVTMSKPRSPKRTLLLTNDPDTWLLNMIEFNHLTGEITENVGYLFKQIPYLIKLRKRQGYEAVWRTKFKGKKIV